MSKTVSCPTCGKSVPWTPESTWRPFCSERCRLIDLGEWLDERHRISERAEEGYEPPEQDQAPDHH
ncbi:MAG: DNA gyrase inhibitor YacG [Pseudomonadota bacterium]|nr:DNA gyrase inhibitor YacG [Pseudomonadota bacterium]